jgi:transcriptional regulator with XRE-family HTH domain
VKPRGPEGYATFVGAISATIRTCRERAGLSQEDVAYGSGLSVRHYQKLEAGESLNPKLENIFGIAAALGMSLSSLIGRAERGR